MADIQWYYAHEEQQAGPISSAELKHLAASGQIGPDDFVWREGMEEWAPASRVKGLFPDHPAAEAHSPAPEQPVPSEIADAEAVEPSLAAATTPPVKMRGSTSLARHSALMQGILWGVCVFVVLLGGLLLTITIVRTSDAQQEAAAGVTFAALSIGAYILARAGEKLLQILADRNRIAD